MSIWLKDPDDICAFQFSWGGFLAAGETITSTTTTADDNLTTVGTTSTDDTTSIEVSGGTHNTQSLLTSVVGTSAGNTYSAERWVYIQTRLLV